MTTPSIRIYTDGSCSPNPGPGGWGAVVLFSGSDSPREVSGGVDFSTNNRMELTAAIEALHLLAQRSHVELYTDSRYLQKGVTQWLASWKSNGWRTADGSEVKNRDLWEKLSRLMELHSVEWRWIKGHSDNHWNNRADQLASTARPAPAPGESPAEEGVHLFTGVTWKNSTGRGTWVAMLRYGPHVKILGGAVEETTANRLYLTALIEGMRALKKRLPVYLFTRSGYLHDGLSTWIAGWQRRSWLTRDGHEVSNSREWKEIVRLQQLFDIRLVTIGDQEIPCYLQEAKELAREFDAEGES